MTARTRSRRGRAWTEPAIREELTAFLAGRTTWPTYGEFIASGAKGLREAVARVGGAEYWAREMGLADSVHPRGGRVRWTEQTIEAALGELLAGRGSWPTRSEFAAAGLRGLGEVLRARGEAALWARRMGVAPPRRLTRPRRPRKPTAPQTTDRSATPWPRWTEETIAAALSAFLAGREEWPTHAEFVKTGRKGLYHAILKHGGSRVWARRMGVRWVDRTRRSQGLEWDEDRLRAELASFLSGCPTWPTAREFAANGRRDLLTAMRRQGGAERWRREFSLPRTRPTSKRRPRRSPEQPSRRRAPRERRWTDERIEAAIAPLIESLGRWPTKAEFRRAGQSRALTAVYDHGGSARWQRHFGVVPRRRSTPVPDRRRWTEARIERELRILFSRHGHWPSERQLREHVPRGLYSAVVRHGGVRRWRERLTSPVESRTDADRV